MKDLIYITEDDLAIGEMVQLALETQGYDTQLFERAEHTLKACEERLPSLFVFDILLPGIDGVQAVKKIRRRMDTRSLPVLLLTAKDTEFDKVTGLDSGADDYLAKPFSVEELGARIRALLRRNKKDTPIVSLDGISVNYISKQVFLKGEQLSLTNKELEVLYYLMKNNNRVVERDELLDTVWGVDFQGEPRTLDTHIKSLRKKLTDKDYILTVRNVGYRFCGNKH